MSKLKETYILKKYFLKINYAVTRPFCADTFTKVLTFVKKNTDILNHKNIAYNIAYNQKGRMQIAYTFALFTQLHTLQDKEKEELYGLCNVIEDILNDIVENKQTGLLAYICNPPNKEVGRIINRSLSHKIDKLNHPIIIDKLRKTQFLNRYTKKGIKDYYKKKI